MVSPKPGLEILLDVFTVCYKNKIPTNGYLVLVQLLWSIRVIYIKYINNELTCAPSEDSDQPGHPQSLISLCFALSG